MHADEEIRVATPADIPLIRTLFRGVFGADRGDELWEWKYFDPARPGLSVVCRAGGRIVAHCGGIPVTLRHRESGRAGAMQSVDFMSSRTYPGGTGAGGVFVRTARRFFAEAAERGVTLLYGFPGERHRLLGEQLLGYVPVENVGELTISSAGSSARDRLRTITRSDLVRFQLPAGLNTIHAERSSEYLEWRYLRHPQRSYLLLDSRWFLNMRAGALAILGEQEDSFQIMEMSIPEAPGALRRFAGDLALLGKPVKAWISPASPVTAKLVAAGFSVSERDHFLEILMLSATQMPAAGEFYYSLGDYDVY